MAGLTFASDGGFSGTTTQGGANCVYTRACGTVFKEVPPDK